MPDRPNITTSSRRTFVKTSLAAVAATGFPTIVPSSVFGQLSPSNRINVGAIGVGRTDEVPKGRFKLGSPLTLVARVANDSHLHDQIVRALLERDVWRVRCVIRRGTLGGDNNFINLFRLGAWRDRQNRQQYGSETNAHYPSPRNSREQPMPVVSIRHAARAMTLLRPEALAS